MLRRTTGEWLEIFGDTSVPTIVVNTLEDLTTDPSNRNSNKGIVNVEYEPYTDLVDAMKELNTQAYRLIEFFGGASYSDTSSRE